MEGVIFYVIIIGLSALYNVWKKKNQTPESRERQQRQRQARQRTIPRQQQQQPGQAKSSPKPAEVQVELPEFLRDLLNIPRVEKPTQPSRPKPVPKPVDEEGGSVFDTGEFREADTPPREFHDHQNAENLHNWKTAHAYTYEAVPTQGRANRKKLSNLLGNIHAVRRAIIVKEILDKPIALRRMREGYKLR